MSSLNRIILIDTHLSGVVELKLDGHTNICGTNASGKTTLQRLIPVFYGEYPSRVVPSTRDSFERWYLRNETSFIVYEFVRHNQQLCQAVLTSTGKGVDYRFINKPFDLEDYSEALATGERKILSPIEISRALRREGILCTRQLNTKEYRAIIQNDRAILNTNRELPGLASAFSLCESHAHLRHIEKLAKAVHSKEGKMETIKAMVAAILEEDGVQPGSSKISRNTVEDWIKECKLIKGFDAIRPEFTKLEQTHHEYISNNKRLAELKHQYAFDKSMLDKALVENQGQFDDVQLMIKQLEKTWNQTRDELNNTLSQAKADINSLEVNLEQVESDYDNWQEKDIDTLTQHIQALPSWKSELESAESSYRLLTEKHQDIKAAYHERVSELTEQHNAEMEAYAVQRDELRDQLADKKSEQQTQALTVRQKYQERINQIKDEYQQRLSSLQNQLTELNTLVKSAGFTEQEQQQLDILDATIKEAGSIEDASRDQLKQSEAELIQAQTAREKVSRSLEQSRRVEQEKQTQVEKVEALLYPGHNTLLEYLRKERPEWADTIGKVINPALLNRNDLKPLLAQPDTSLYGLLLELNNIEQPEYAQSEHSLQRQLELAQAELGQAVAARNTIEGALAEQNNTVRVAELALAKCKTECNNAEQNRKRSQQDKDNLTREFQQALSERKQNYQSRLAAVKDEQQAVKMQLDDALAQVKEAQHEEEMDSRSHWQLVLSDLQQQVDQIDAHRSKAKDNVALEKKQCEAWFKDELANRGVDVDEIGKLKKQISSLQKDIKHTEQNRHLVSEYQHWYKTYYTGHKVKWQQHLADAKTIEGDTTRQLQSQETQYKQDKSLAISKQSYFEQQLKETKELSHNLDSVTKQLAKLTLPVAEIVEEKASIAQRINEGQALLGNRAELEANIKAYVEHFDQQIASQAGTGLSDIWDRSREECMTSNAQGIRQINHVRLVTHLDQLLNIHVPQRMTTLRELGRTFGKDLSEYYKILKEIEAHIGLQSKRISREVDEELFLDGVSDSAVKIRSRISDLEFWPELQLFNQLYAEWMEDGAHQLPSDEYAQSMRRVLDILGRAALEGGISKLLDIELHIHEGNSDLIIRTDRQLNESSSHGMAYLILCKFLLAFTRLLRGRSDTIIHWPIDELGTLHQTNIKKIFDACQNNNIRVVGAFPNPESEVLTLFENRYLIAKKDGERRLQVVEPKVSELAKRIQQKKQAEQVTEGVGA
ncbi:ATP-binding protein [Flocculibacter collagenilyticus]|uniref:ATP-binding protein n=1 Tax=Flocculibacter collagenilyticus TaxID=2744479 RepID=UPI0018F56A43|nr:ATP-binding protein [Flocculibacter collagenilyticus]